MKKVVKVLVSTEVDVDSITDKSHIGILWGGCDTARTWIQENKGEFIGQTVGDISMSSRWRKFSKKVYVEEAISMDAEVFLFDTYIELYNWLISAEPK